MHSIFNFLVVFFLWIELQRNICAFQLALGSQQSFYVHVDLPFPPVQWLYQTINSLLKSLPHSIQAHSVNDLIPNLRQKFNLVASTPSYWYLPHQHHHCSSLRNNSDLLLSKLEISTCTQDPTPFCYSRDPVPSFTPCFPLFSICSSLLSLTVCKYVPIFQDKTPSTLSHLFDHFVSTLSAYHTSWKNAVYWCSLLFYPQPTSEPTTSWLLCLSLLGNCSDKSFQWLRNHQIHRIIFIWNHCKWN